MRFRALLATFVLSLFAASAWAQTTTSSISGVITDSDGNPVPNANVVIVHQPTGTRRETSSQAGGQYRASGLRVGGPYTVTITADGYNGDRFEDIFLALQDDFELNAVIEEGSLALDAIEVTGSVVASGIYTPDNMGTSTVVTQQELETLPTVSRSLRDFARLDPRVVIPDEGGFAGISVAGQNNRYNNVTVDAVPINDEFGLESNGQPAKGEVVSIDAIEEVQINVAPYDVSLGSFTGGSINAVTKSGTNEFSGSLTYLFRDEDLIGEDELGNEFPIFEEDIISATFGGPIIKDKLFFFISAESVEKTEPGPAVAYEPASAELARIIDIAQNQYGFDPGAVVAPSDLQDEEDKILAKVDWNINQNHRATFQYQKTEGVEAIIGGRGSSSFSLGSYWYNNDFNRDSFVGLLYSDWTPNFSTEFNFSVSDFEKQPRFNRLLPQIRIEDVPGAGGDVGDVLLGTERFRHANRLDAETSIFYGAGEYLMGDHTIKFGMDYKSNDFFNTFVFSSAGEYTFLSIDDFAAGTPDFYQLRIGTDPSDPYPAADWAYDMIGLFVQDTWDLSHSFTLQYGVRVDIPQVDDRPLFNQDFQDAYGFSNQETIDGNEVVQPRVGFNWDLSTGEYSAQLRGGLGLFMGSSAGVWLSNPFTNPGGNVAVFRDFGTPGIFSPDPLNQPRPGGEGSAVQDVDVVAPGFEQPTVWKANIAYDRELPWGVQMTAEILHTEVENGIQYRHLNLGEPTGVLPDGRLTFHCDPTSGSMSSRNRRCNADDRFNDVLLLENTGLGSSTMWTLELSKQFTPGFRAGVSATKARSTDVNSGTSSRAISNWNNRAIVNPNEEVEATSNYQHASRYTGWLSYSRAFFGDNETRIGLFYENRDLRPYSFVFDNDANGDGIFDNDLLYVPTGPGDVHFDDPAEEAAFFALVEQYDCLNDARGTIVRRNSCKSERIHQVDLRISQEIPLFFDTKGELYFNILNLGNLLDETWGLIDEVPFEYVAEAVDFEGLTDDGRYIYDLRRDSFTRRVDGDAESRWQAQLGIKIRF